RDHGRGASPRDPGGGIRPPAGQESRRGPGRGFQGTGRHAHAIAPDAARRAQTGRRRRRTGHRVLPSFALQISKENVVIEFLRGKLSVKTATRLVVEVGGGVGFGVDVSLRTAERVGNPGDAVQILTYLHVREEALDLYGFADAAERALFLKLLGVSGVGPRLALRILSAVSPQKLADMILHGDVRGLTAMKGVGKKTAEVLIASLRSGLSKLDLPRDA